MEPSATSPETQAWGGQHPGTGAGCPPFNRPCPLRAQLSGGHQTPGVARCWHPAAPLGQEAPAGALQSPGVPHKGHTWVRDPWTAVHTHTALSTGGAIPYPGTLSRAVHAPCGLSTLPARLRPQKPPHRAPLMRDLLVSAARLCRPALGWGTQTVLFPWDTASTMVTGRPAPAPCCRALPWRPGLQGARSAGCPHHPLSLPHPWAPRHGSAVHSVPSPVRAARQALDSQPGQKRGDPGAHSHHLQPLPAAPLLPPIHPSWATSRYTSRGAEPV